MRRIIAAVLLSTVWTAATADFEAGFKAYERGDYATALREWQPLAEQGDATAQFNLGLMYRQGRGGPQRRPPSRVLVPEGSRTGNASAQFNLGFMYDNGEGVPEDDRQAVFWFRKAADQGHASAQYDNGDGRPRRQPPTWERHVQCPVQPGNHVQQRRGRPRRRPPSRVLVPEGSRPGSRQCPVQPGTHVRNGEGVPEDDKPFWYQAYALVQPRTTTASPKDRQAVFWFRKAADQGHASAQSNLGVMYGTGEECP